MGTNLKYMGKAGCGQHTKMCNQILIATNMVTAPFFLKGRLACARV